MDRDGDGKVEDGCRGRPSVQCGHGRASGLRGAIWSQDLGLELQQLPHEAEVGGDDASPLLDKLKGFVQFDPVGPHEVSEADGR